jgi:hypothetical protein
VEDQNRTDNTSTANVATPSIRRGRQLGKGRYSLIIRPFINLPQTLLPILIYSFSPEFTSNSTRLEAELHKKETSAVRGGVGGRQTLLPILIYSFSSKFASHSTGLEAELHKKETSAVRGGVGGR